MNKTRPCVVKIKRESVEATFHAFVTNAYVVEPSLMLGGTPGGQINIPRAIVELKDGTVRYVEPTSVTFIDHLKIKVTDDHEKARKVYKAVHDNDGYCPCELNKTPDTKCMCKSFRTQVIPGPCHCGLYEKYAIEVQHV